MYAIIEAIIRETEDVDTLLLEDKISRNEEKARQGRNQNTRIPRK